MRCDLERVADSLGLRRAGSEYKGPCPCCGGDDRFHVKAGRSADLLVYCRHGCRYSDIARELERRGIIESDEYQPQAYRKADLEYCDFLLLVMEGAIAKGETELLPSDAVVIGRLLKKVDPERADKLRDARTRLIGGNNGRRTVLETIPSEQDKQI